MKPTGVTKQITGGKLTSEGLQCWTKVPHMNVCINGLAFDAPVAVRHRKGATAMVAIECERDEHGYVYALPNGGRINSLGTIL
jgi:hypothetical protein